MGLEVVDDRGDSSPPAGEDAPGRPDYRSSAACMAAFPAVDTDTHAIWWSCGLSDDKATLLVVGG